MLATTSVLIKTEDGREALAARRHDMQMRQRHLLILIDGARTVGQLHQLLSDWSDLDALLVGLQQAGMVDLLPGVSLDGASDLAPPAATFDPVTYFNRPLFDEERAHGTLSAIYDELPPLTGMTLGLQTVAAPVDVPAANEPRLPALELPELPAREALTHIPSIPVLPELADVLPNVRKVELMRLAITHFGADAGAALSLLRSCQEDTESLCNVIAACAKAAAPTTGEKAAARFVDAAMLAMAQRR